MNIPKQYFLSKNLFTYYTNSYNKYILEIRPNNGSGLQYRTVMMNGGWCHRVYARDWRYVHFSIDNKLLSFTDCLNLYIEKNFEKLI